MRANLNFCSVPIWLFPLLIAWIDTPTCAHTHTQHIVIITEALFFSLSKTGCLAKVGSMTTCVLLFAVVLLIVSMSFFLRPPAAQERQGAVLVLTSPSVTLTSHYQIQLVPGPAPLLKQRVPLSPHTLHPHLSTPFSLCFWPPLPVYSLAPGRHVCTMEIKQRERERDRVSLSIICAVALSFSSPSLCLSSTRSPVAAGAAQTLARCEPWWPVWTGKDRITTDFCGGKRDRGMNGGTEGWIVASRDSLQRPWLSLSHAFCLVQWLSSSTYLQFTKATCSHKQGQQSWRFMLSDCHHDAFFGCYNIILLSEIKCFYLLVFMCISKMFG